jgi:hypothetical protein
MQRFTVFGIAAMAVIAALSVTLVACKKPAPPDASVAADLPAGHPISKLTDCLTIAAPTRPTPATPPRSEDTELRFQPDCPPGDGACGAWTRFRQDHPYPYQSFAGERLADGKAVLVISEPPPNISHADALALVNTVFGDRAPNAQVRRWMIGSDGYVEDLVVTFAAPALASDDLLADPDLRSRIALLEQAWFGTTCGGDVEVIGRSALGGGGDVAPNLQVTAAELGHWMSDGQLLWTRIEDDRPVGFTWAELSGDTPQDGAFVSSDGTLALLSFDRSALDQPDKVAALRADFRRFAVSSDAIVGAVWGQNGRMGLVGRVRTHSLSQIPALRFETFALIAAQHADALLQSYDRTNPLAGKMSDGRDWAPIYLSPALVDSEMGALMNITDQLLKSLSEAGTVDYKYFYYPMWPHAFPFKAPLSEQLRDANGATQVLFNWNTTGSAAQVDLNGMTVMVSRQLGALPVTYGSDLQGSGPVQTGHLVGYEDRAYDYFAHLRDPNLARVVQYTLIYQALRNSQGVASPGPADAVQSAPPDAQAAAASVVEAPGMAVLVGRMQQLLGQLGTSGTSPADAAYLAFKKAHGDIGVDLLAILLADPRNAPGILSARPGNPFSGISDPNAAIATSNRDVAAFNADVDRVNANGGANASQQSEFNARRNELDARKQQLEAAEKLMDDLTPLGSAVSDAVSGSDIDLAALRAAFEQADRHQVAGWIRTPTDVVSWGSSLEQRLSSVGGHNIVAQDVRLEQSTEIQGVVLRDGRILYNPDQADRVSAHAAELARATEHDAATQADIDKILQGALPPIRDRAVALADAAGDTGRPTAVARLGGRTFDTSGALVDALTAVRTKTPCCRVAMETTDGVILMADAEPHPPPLVSVTQFGDSTSFAAFLRSRPGADVIVLGQPRAHVEAVLASIDLADPQVGLAGLIARARSRTSRTIDGIADVLFGRDLSGRVDAITASVDGADDTARAARLADLRTPMRRAGDIGELDPQTLALLLKPLNWDLARDGDTVAVRASVAPGGGGGGDGSITVLAGFAGGDRRSNLNSLVQIVQRDIDDGESKKSPFTSILMTIRNDISRQPNARRIELAVTKGSTSMQLTEVFGDHPPEGFG